MEIKIVKGEYLDANVYVLIKGGKALIIDAGAKVEEVKKVIGNNKVIAIFLTHGHYDHCLHILDYIKAFDCEVFANENCKITISDPQKNYGEPVYIDKGETFLVDNFEDFQFIKNDGRIVLDKDNFEVKYYYTPGHSECGMCYLIENNLFAGDTLFDNGIGRTDLIGSDKQAMLDSLEKLAPLEFDTLYSGHGQPSDYTRQKRNIAIHIKFLKRAL